MSEIKGEGEPLGQRSRQALRDALMAVTGGASGVVDFARQCPKVFNVFQHAETGRLIPHYFVEDAVRHPAAAVALLDFIANPNIRPIASDADGAAAGVRFGELLVARLKEYVNADESSREPVFGPFPKQVTVDERVVLEAWFAYAIGPEEVPLCLCDPVEYAVLLRQRESGWIERETKQMATPEDLERLTPGDVWMPLMQDKAREHGQRVFLPPTEAELRELTFAFYGYTLVVLQPFQHHDFETTSLSVSVQQAEMSGEDNRTFLRISVRRKGAPDNVRIALDDFPYRLEDSRGNRVLPQRRDGGSLYFRELTFGEMYRFVPLS